MMQKDLEKLYEMIDEIETAMMTTRASDGSLVSRPMATQKRADGADIWFTTLESSGKLKEIENDSHVNLAYYKDRTREWISISGTAKVVRDREKVRELWQPDWKAWFPDEGPGRDGSKDDPRIVLIGVDVDSAFFMELNKPMPVVLFEVAKGMVTGKQSDVGEVKKIQ
jgi:general stress protein 26